MTKTKRESIAIYINGAINHILQGEKAEAIEALLWTKARILDWHLESVIPSEALTFLGYTDALQAAKWMIENKKSYNPEETGHKSQKL